MTVKPVDRLTPEAIAGIKHFEGLHLKPYIDPVGVITVGYGHTKHPNQFLENEQQAHNLLIQDLTHYAQEVEKELGKIGYTPTADGTGYENQDGSKLSNSQFSALTSLAFNIGPGWLPKSTIFKKLKENDMEGAADAFKLFNRAGGRILKGLVRRREWESKLFANGAAVGVQSISFERPQPMAASVHQAAVELKGGRSREQQQTEARDAMAAHSGMGGEESPLLFLMAFIAVSMIDDPNQRREAMAMLNEAAARMFGGNRAEEVRSPGPSRERHAPSAGDDYSSLPQRTNPAEGENLAFTGDSPDDQFGFRGNGSFDGVDARLARIIEETARDFPLRVRVMSGRRGRNTGDHALGLAVDITLYDQNGAALSNYQYSENFRAYELFAQAAYLKAQELYPDLTDGQGIDFNWGGHFGDGGPGKYQYGSNDLMDFRLAVNPRFRGGRIMVGLNQRHDWYDDGDFLEGSKPFSQEVFEADLRRLASLRLTPEQVARNRAAMYGVARASGSLSPRADATERAGTAAVEEVGASLTDAGVRMAEDANAQPLEPALVAALEVERQRRAAREAAVVLI